MPLDAPWQRARMITRAFNVAFTLLMACGTTAEMREPVQDASDAAHSGAPRRDAGSEGDATHLGPLDASSHDVAPARDGGTADASPARDASGPTAAQDAKVEAAQESFVYVGGADWSGQPFPFRSYRLDRDSGALTALQSPLNLGLNPSYATPGANGHFLYVANEDEREPGVTVASIDPMSGQLTKLEQEPFAGGGGFVFTSLDPTGKFVLAADHNGGRAVVYPVQSDGRLAPAVEIETFMSGAHTHSFRTDPSGKWAYVPNKDLNSVAQFAFNAATGALTPLTPTTVPAAGGPRHIAFSPDGKFAFVILEYDDKVNAYAIGPNGALTEIDSKSSLPAGFSGENTGAHVLVHPRGGFVYASNRGHDSIVVFSIDAAGQLKLLQHVSTQGKTPRNFDIDSSGELLVVANQGDDNANNGSLVIFAIGGDGKLSQRGAAVSGLKSPNAVAIVTRARPALSPAP